MKTKFAIEDRGAALAACGAALAAIAMGVVTLADSQSSESTVVGIEHLSLAAFSLTLALLVPAVLRLGRISGGAGPKAAAVAVAGQLVLAALAAVSNLRGEDPAFFAAVAVPANLAILGGWIAIAVGLGRRRLAPLWLAVALPLSYLALLPAGQVGGGILTGLFWLALARWLAAESPRLRFAAA